MPLPTASTTSCAHDSHRLPCASSSAPIGAVHAAVKNLASLLSMQHVRMRRRVVRREARLEHRDELRMPARRGALQQRAAIEHATDVWPVQQTQIRIERGGHRGHVAVERSLQRRHRDEVARV